MTTEYSEQKHQNSSEIVAKCISFNPLFEIQTGIQLPNNNLAAAQYLPCGEADYLRELKPFRCYFAGCEKDYSNKSRLDIHMRTHVS